MRNAVFGKNIELVLFFFFFLRNIGEMKHIFGMIIGLLATLHPVEGSDNFLETDDPAPAVSECRDIEFVFARGSGAERMASAEWTAFRDEMSRLAGFKNYSYRVSDLDYPAVSVQKPFTNALGALVSAGQYYKFGQSV